mgnify:CR=1 FL=1
MNFLLYLILLFCQLSRLDCTLGYNLTSRELSNYSRTNQNNSSPRTRYIRSSSQTRSGQLTVLDYLQAFNERLTHVEQQMHSMTNILQRIDDRMNQVNNQCIFFFFYCRLCLIYRTVK